MMKNKTILLASLIAVALVALVAGSVLAAPAVDQALYPGGPGRGGRGAGLRGEITAIGDGEFTLETSNGDEVTVAVDDDTRYGGDLDSFDDLEVGLEVGVAAYRNADEGAVAKAVVAGAQLDATRAGGEVTEVGSDTLTIEDRNGESYTFDVNADTEYHSRDGSVESLSDISVGDHAMVIYEEDGSSLVALVIGSGTPQLDGSGGPGNGLHDGQGGGTGNGRGSGPQDGSGQNG